MPAAWVLTLPMDLATLAAPSLWISGYWRGVLALAVVAVAVFATMGLYVGRCHLSFLDILPRLLAGLLISTAVIAVIGSFRHDSFGFVEEFMHASIQSGGLLLLGRILTIRTVLTVRSRRWIERRVMVVGSGQIAASLARILADHSRYGMHVVGYLADGGDQLPPSQFAPWLGPVNAIGRVIRDSDVRVVIIADTDAPEDQIIDHLRDPTTTRSILYVVPRLYHVHNQAGANDHIGAIPVVRLRRPTLSGPRWFVKRLADVIAAIAGLALLSPLLVICGLLVLIDGGPRGIFFRQERVGRDGRIFRVIKFRTMRPATKAEADTQWSIADDGRVRPIGRFLRRTSLDELPQLWNILSGNMTFVGPRPERPHFVTQFAAMYPEYAHRHRAPAGLTGLAQVSGLRGDTPIADRARFDNYYIDNWSIWLDIKVALRTFGELFRGGRH